MLDVHRNPTAREVRVFGALVVLFAGALAALAIRRPASLLGAAGILVVAWAVSLLFSAPLRRRPLVGLALPSGLAALGTLARWLHPPAWNLLGALLGAGVLLALAVWSFPAFGARLWGGWMRAAEPAGWTFSHVVLAVVYFGVLTPIGLLMRLAGRDAMRRRFERGAPTYWVRRETERDPTRYFKQF